MPMFSIMLQPQINEMLQTFAANSRSQAARRRNRSVSESAGDASPSNRVRRLSGGSSAVTLPTSSSENNPAAQKSRVDSVNLSQLRNRANSFGSGRLSHPRRRNDTSSLNSQRDLSKQQQQPRNRQSSGLCTKTQQEVSGKPQNTGRDRLQTSKSEQTKSITIKTDNTSISQK